jgi:hypothetical protein
MNAYCAFINWEGHLISKLGEAGDVALHIYERIPQTNWPQSFSNKGGLPKTKKRHRVAPPW